MSKSTELPRLLIIEFGGQLTLKIASGYREMGYRTAILNPAQAMKMAAQYSIEGIILSGGLASVYDENSPKPPPEIFSLRNSRGFGVPILGICYGMQAIAHHFGGRVERRTPQYGPAVINLSVVSPLFADTPKTQKVWASHGDSVAALPEGFNTTATYQDTQTVAAFADEHRRVWGVQFHPEAEETQYGKAILKNFATACLCKRDWNPTSLVEEIRENMLAPLSTSDEVVHGMSGGVDSTTVLAIAHPALGKRLHPFAIDAGNLRENETTEIVLHAKAAGVDNLPVINASDRFFAALEGVSDAQEKRKGGFQPNYSGIFQETAQRFGPQVKWMMQGTLAPDRIESGATGGDLIKTHHNVGLDTGHLRQIHPVDHLFKYEIRALAREIGLPKSVSERQPFPGPGLFIRHIGSITRKGIETVRWSDGRTKEVLVHHGIYEKLSQLVVAYFAQPVVGIKGDKRCYAGFAGVRGVRTIDFMTAEGYAFDADVQHELCRVLGKHPDIVHVAFFPMPKPPGTTEFE